MTNLVRYCIQPVYGDAAAMVVQAASLRTAMEAAFNCCLVFVDQIETDVFISYGDRVTMYALIGALGKNSDNYSVLCSATITTYDADYDRLTSDVNDIRQLTKRTMEATNKL